MSLPKAYIAKKYESTIYRAWEKSGVFRPKIDPKKKPFTISMPPPNATGTLHLGHAVMLAIQDIMIRYHRMKGIPSLWLPGTDHASIATQNKVEQEIAKEGKTRHNLGRAQFLERVHEFVKNSQHVIRNQVRKMGSSCDWSRERYTLDPGLSRAVQEVFVRMYWDDLIYRGNRIVNWCPRCASTLADDEVKYKEEKAKFYYLKYGPFVIGTARPETKFQDKIIAVHPDDKRYKKYHGKELMVEWIEGLVKAKIIPDLNVDPNFGSGAMTLTPAHDFVDFDIAVRHKLDIVKIIDEKGMLTDAAGSFAGKNAREARPEILKKLQEKGLVEKIDENYLHNISICYRCSTPIEPLVSKQWFVDVNKKFKNGKSLKQMAIEFVKKGRIKILPGRFNKTYFHWLENLRDWCISRQIWFGHRIPVYYCKKCNKIVVRLKKPSRCPSCKHQQFRQDPDTLDTWFSSGLWTFSTLGWPKKTRDLNYFHPTSVLETGYDILFFWVARMIIMTAYSLNDIPFHTVYLHGLVRTRSGEKMSKSKPETCIDPLDMIEKYGADALRISMLIGSGPGNDIRLYEEKIAGYRNFVNKIWNACRFALLNVTPQDLKKRDINRKKLSTADKWILTRTQKLIKSITQKLDNYQFSEAGTEIYDFTWGEYCDWYLEVSKTQKNTSVLVHVLKNILKLLHPFVPFVTEVLWQELDHKKLLIAESWPQEEKKLRFEREEKEFNLVIDIISKIRSVRAELNVQSSKKIHAIIYCHDSIKIIKSHQEEIKKLAQLENLDLYKTGHKVSQSIGAFIHEVEIYLPLKDMVNAEEEEQRLKKELEEKLNYLESINRKLKNNAFVSNAPREIVKQERDKAGDLEQKIKKIREHLKMLNRSSQ